MSEKTDIKSMNLEELKTFFSDMGEKAFRAKQVYEWLHVRQVESFEEMTNLSKTLRERLDETCRIITLRKEQWILTAHILGEKRTGTDFKTGWNPQISVFTGRRKCH